MARQRPQHPRPVGNLRNVFADQTGVFADGAAEVLDIDAEGADVVSREDVVAAPVIGARGDQPLAILQDRAAVTPLIAVGTGRPFDSGFELDQHATRQQPVERSTQPGFERPARQNAGTAVTVPQQQKRQIGAHGRVCCVARTRARGPRTVADGTPPNLVVSA